MLRFSIGIRYIKRDENRAKMDKTEHGMGRVQEIEVESVYIFNGPIHPLKDGVHCQRCTCKWCGYAIREGSCWICPSKDRNTSIDAPNSFNDLPNVFTHPPQPQYDTYSYELYGNDSHHGYDCPPRFPLVYEQEPSYNQNFSDNYYLQNLPSFPQQYLCCENYGGPHESFQCQSINQNYFEHNSNYSGFDQPPQYSIDHQEDLNQQRISDVHDRWDKLEESQNELLNMLQSFCEMVIQQKQAANLCTYIPEPLRRFNSFYDDDDYKESTIPLNEITSQIPPITPVLPTMEPEDSLSMGDEHLSTIPEKESDEFIKSSVEDLVPIPSESEDISGSDSDCDLPSCNDFSPINIPKEKSVTLSNLSSIQMMILPLVMTSHYPMRMFRKIMLKFTRTLFSNSMTTTSLVTTVDENRASWSDKLDDALWAFPITFKTPIGCTPYKLVYGKACHLPIELEHKAFWALKHCNFDLKTAGEHRKVQMNELNELQDQAYGTL
ncbi:putative reverse transcriptase domain-containing protein [Tanacetum coccineum]